MRKNNLKFDDMVKNLEKDNDEYYRYTKINLWYCDDKNYKSKFTNILVSVTADNGRGCASFATANRL